MLKEIKEIYAYEEFGCDIYYEYSCDICGEMVKYDDLDSLNNCTSIFKEKIPVIYDPPEWATTYPENREFTSFDTVDICTRCFRRFRQIHARLLSSLPPNAPIEMKQKYGKMDWKYYIKED